MLCPCDSGWRCSGQAFFQPSGIIDQGTCVVYADLLQTGEESLVFDSQFGRHLASAPRRTVHASTVPRRWGRHVVTSNLATRTAGHAGVLLIRRSPCARTLTLWNGGPPADSLARQRHQIAGT